jgi:drug/metabolite transporter (DMT)-like permease
MRGVLLGLCSSFVGATAAAAGKHLIGMVHMSTIVLVQYSVCLLCTLPWLLREGRGGGLATRHPWLHVVRGVSGCGCFYLFYLSMQHIPLVDATLMRSSAPLMVPLIVLVWFRERVAPIRWLPLGIGFAGITLILDPHIAGVDPWHMAALFSGLGLAISMVTTRLLSQSEPEGRVLFYYFAISLLFIVPFWLNHLEPIPLAAWPWLLYVGIAMYVTFVLYNRAYTYVKASVLAPTNYFGVLFAGVLEWLIWQHVPDARGLLGIVLVVTGGVLVLALGNPAPKPGSNPAAAR